MDSREEYSKAISLYLENKIDFNDLLSINNSLKNHIDKNDILVTFITDLLTNSFDSDGKRVIVNEEFKYIQSCLLHEQEFSEHDYNQIKMKRKFYYIKEGYIKLLEDYLDNNISADDCYMWNTTYTDYEFENDQLLIATWSAVHLLHNYIDHKTDPTSNAELDYLLTCLRNEAQFDKTILASIRIDPQKD